MKKTLLLLSLTLSLAACNLVAPAAQFNSESNPVSSSVGWADGEQVASDEQGNRASTVTRGGETALRVVYGGQSYLIRSLGDTLEIAGEGLNPQSLTLSREALGEVLDTSTLRGQVVPLVIFGVLRWAFIQTLKKELVRFGLRAYGCAQAADFLASRGAFGSWPLNLLNSWQRRDAVCVLWAAL